MKLVQAVGNQTRDHYGIFHYQRTVEGVAIDLSIRGPGCLGKTIGLTHAEWMAILKAVRDWCGDDADIGTEGGLDALEQRLRAAIPEPRGGWEWDGCWVRCVATILEHEGTVRFRYDQDLIC